MMYKTWKNGIDIANQEGITQHVAEINRAVEPLQDAVHSAYDALAKENEELRQEIKSQKKHYEKMFDMNEITSLRESLKKQECNCPHCDKHRGLD